MLRVLKNANNVLKTRITATKEETALASIVPLDGRPKMAVQNAKRAVRERSVRVAKIARWGLQEKEMTLMRRNADNVNWVKQRRWKAWPRAVGVI